ncbi:MAG: efflux RND transporter periplasmic adaptor subunit [Schlesneria sp.]
MTQNGNETDSRTFRPKPNISALTSVAKYLGILCGLLAIGILGHETHWSFGFMKHEIEEHSSVFQSSKLPVTIDDDQPVDKEWHVDFPSEKSLRRTGIKTTVIEERSMRERIKTTGVIKYDERMFASLSARVSGTVWRVLKQPGDMVRRGDVLVIIDAADVGQAKAKFSSDLVALESKMERLAAFESVVGAIAQRQIRDERVALREAKIRLQNTEQTLINMGFSLKNGLYESLNDTDRAAKLHFLGIPDSISQDLDRVQTTSNLLPVTASFDGVLVNHDAALGEMVEAGKPLLEIADLRRMWLFLDVSKEDASKMTLGQSVRFLPDGLNHELQSTISWISTEMNEKTRTLRVRAEVDNPIVSSDPVTGHEVRLLRAKTYGTGMITLRETPSAFVVPVSAVLHDDSQPMVFAKVSDRKFARIGVKLGAREGGCVQIDSPELKPGMEIVTHGSHALKSEWILTHVASSAL